MSVGHIEVDSSAWPIVVVRPRGQPTEGQYLAMFRQFEAIWDRKERFLSITDTRLSEMGSALQRQLIGEWMKKSEAKVNAYSMGSIVIVSSSLVRGALTAINWIARPKIPSIYVATPTEAADHARRLLMENGLRVDRAAKLAEDMNRRLAA